MASLVLTDSSQLTSDSQHLAVNPQQRTSDVSSELLEDRFSIPKFYRDIKSPKESFFSPVDSFIKKSPNHFSSSSNKKLIPPKSRLINQSKRESLRTVADGQEPQLSSKVTTKLSTNTTFIKAPNNSFKNLKKGSEESPKKLQKDHISSLKIINTRIPSPINKSSHQSKIDLKIIQGMAVKQEEADEIIKAEEVERDIIPRLENSTDKKPDIHIGGFHKEIKPRGDYLNARDLANKILMDDAKERIALKKKYTNMEFTGPNSNISISKLIKTPRDIRSQAISRLDQTPSSPQQSMRLVVEAKSQKGERSTESSLENTQSPFDFIRELKKEEVLKNTEIKDESTGKAGNKNVGINMTLIGDKLQVSGAPSRLIRSKSFITAKCEAKSVFSCDVQTQTVDLSKGNKVVIKNTGSRKRPILGEVKTKEGKYSTNTEANMRLSDLPHRNILPKTSKVESPGSSGGSSDGTYTVDQNDAEREEELTTIHNISKEGQEHLGKKGKFTGAIANLITKSRAVSFVRQKKTLKNCESGKADRSRKIKEIEVSDTPEYREKHKPKVEDKRIYSKQSMYKKEHIKNSLTTKRTEMTKRSESFVEPKLPLRKISSKMSRIPIPVSPKK
uniref:Uncharacterized protein n=1 Tax=Timema poppense TaxID=170557 RepID=A0A7R9H1A4_TIMPO|nr:unnamed protein product [Timema poppensis]